MSGAVSARLPDFPWDKLTEYAVRARSHAEGIVDLSVGTPVDPTPAVAQQALCEAADSPGYPVTIGRPETRQAIVDWLARTAGATGIDVDGVLPVIGSKELIGALPMHLGLGPGDLIVQPALAYPTYEVGARLAGARWVRGDAPQLLDGPPPTYAEVHAAYTAKLHLVPRYRQVLRGTPLGLTSPVWEDPREGACEGFHYPHTGIGK